MEMLGQVSPRTTLHAPPQGVRSGALPTPRRLWTRFAAGENAHAVISTRYIGIRFVLHCYIDRAFSTEII